MQIIRRLRASAAAASALLLIAAGAFAQPLKSINSTSQNRATLPPTLVSEQPFSGLADFQLLGANDLGMHCTNLDQRAMSILPPFNTLHAQVLQKGHTPAILDQTQMQVVYSAASNPNDPVLANQVPSTVFKSNFWDINPRTGNPYAFDAYNPYYPPGILSLFPLTPDMGLPAPDLFQLYLGGHKLVAAQQAMPSATSPPTTYPYVANVPQPFNLFYPSFPFFSSFPFGYILTNVRWFSADGIPIMPFDDVGRMNPYPLARVQAQAKAGNTLGLSAGTVASSLDVVTPVSGEMSCQNCHAATSDGGDGSATTGKGFTVATRFDDPQYGSVPISVSIAYAYALNVIRLHDVKNGTHLEAQMPVACQKCHYSPALDLAHVGPKGPGDPDANGREQTLHHTMSRAMHMFHGLLKTPAGNPVFVSMPGPVGRSTVVRDQKLLHSCYLCHPGAVTKCFRGVMFDAGAACQDCHGGMGKVGNDFSGKVSPKNPGAFNVGGDYYTNPNRPRIPWANEPMCQSCHTGDAVNNLTASPNVVVAADKIHLLRAWRTGDPNAKPIVATNRRFAENQSNTRQVLYRLSIGHGGVFCEGCHNSTHAEWPAAATAVNDNVAPIQLQGHAGFVMECETCHGPNAFTEADFLGNFDSAGRMKGPHGMHPVNDPNGWMVWHPDVFQDGATPPKMCKACHGKALKGTVLARVPVDRTLPCEEAGFGGCVDTPGGPQITLKAGTKVGCGLCHSNPASGGGS